jgi:C_GCAxxG_C_C family probable redox protein
MSRRNPFVERAVKRFDEGYNCAQSVLLAMSEHWGIESDIIPKIATGFGSGIGRCGSVCGALTGGVMSIGIKYGADEPSPEKRQNCYELALRLYRLFEQQHGSVLCRELIGYDLSDSEGLKSARKAKVFEEKCPIFVRTVVNVLVDLEKS